MNALSLFTGIGGLDLAAEAAGIRTVAMCERDPFCRKVLRKHWPDVPIFEDVRVLSKGVLIDAGVSPIELIHGGFPCQPFSLAGRQRGKADDRYLWPEFSRIIAEIMPRWVICENVPGILSIAADDICQDLERKGYEVGVFDYEAAAVGAKHRRARVFFVAHSESGRCDPRHSERYGSHEKNRAGANNQTPGSGEPSAFIPNPGRRMRERGAIPGEIRGEPETRPLADVERSGCSSLPDAQSRGRRQGTENTEGRGKGIESWTWDRPSLSRSDFPDPDGERKLQPRRSIAKLRERPCYGHEATPDPDLQRREEQQFPLTADGERASLGSIKCCRGRITEPGMGRDIDGLSSWMDGDWERGIPRVVKGVKNRVSRLRALGNAVVPAQAYGIFRAIAEIEVL